MIKLIHVAECDICGVTQPAIAKGTQWDEYYEVPKGWQWSKTNSQFCICPECSKKLSKEELK